MTFLDFAIQILRSGRDSDHQRHVFLMLKDRYTDSCLVYAATKMTTLATSAHISEKLDELTHTMKTAESQVFSRMNSDKRHYN